MSGEIENTIWVVYEWHRGEEMTEDDKGHFLNHLEAYKFMESLWEYPFDAAYHLEKVSIVDEQYCPRCGANLKTIFPGHFERFQEFFDGKNKV